MPVLCDFMALWGPLMPYPQALKDLLAMVEQCRGGWGGGGGEEVGGKLIDENSAVKALSIWCL